MNRKRLIPIVVLGATLLGCNPEVTLLNTSFLNLVQGGAFPIAPGPNSGFIAVMGMNSTSQSIEFVVTAESEETIVSFDEAGAITGFASMTLETEAVRLITDVDSPTLAIVFDNTPADFPPRGPGGLSLADIQSVLQQLVARDPEFLQDREFVRLVRVLRIGLGPDLDVPSGEDDGIVIRPPLSDPETTAGSIFPSRINNALSFDSGNDPADFGNGDMLIFLATTQSNAVGGVQVTAGIVDGDEANRGGDTFAIDTFEILRNEEGPIEGEILE